MEIENVNLVNRSVLSLTFNFEWSYDDITILQQHIFCLIPSPKIVELIVGADRQTTRFMIKNSNISLHFEEYSQSCWFEALSVDDIPALLEISSLLH
jgi:hypothetical protein